MWLLLGWIVTMVGFVVAIDYTCAQIKEVGQRVDGLKEELRSVGRSIDNCAASDLEMLSREIREFHATLAGGLAALLEKNSTANGDGFATLFTAVSQVEVSKLLWNNRDEAQDTDSAEQAL